MRVLHVLEASLGGTRRYLHGMVEASRKLPTVKFGLVYSSVRADSGWAATVEAARASGWATWEVSMRREISPMADARAVSAVRSALRSFRADVVHGHSSKGGAVARLAAIGSSAMVVYSPHSIASNLAARYLYIERGLSKLTDRFAAVSDSERDELVALGVASSDRVHVVYPVVSGIAAPETRAAPGDNLPPKLRLCAIGRLVAQKRPLDLVLLVEELTGRGHEVECVWVGDGDLKEEFLAFAESRGVAARVRVTGWVNDVAEYLMSASVLVSTANYESFGFAVAEALLAGVPVVATRIVGTSDVLQGELSRWMYAVGDVKGAADLVEGLIVDPALRKRLGEMGKRSISDRFGVDAMCAAMTALYSR